MQEQTPVGNYMFKVNNRNTTGVILVFLLLTLNYFTPCSSVSIEKFAQANADWDTHRDQFLICVRTKKKSTSWRQISSVLSSSFPKRILKLLKIILNCTVFCCQYNWQKQNTLVTETKKKAIFQYLKWLNKIVRVCLSCSLFDLNKKKNTKFQSIFSVMMQLSILEFFNENSLF